MDGRICLVGFAFMLALGGAGCVTPQSQKAVMTDTGGGKVEEVAISTKADGPKLLPKATTEVALGRLKEAEAESDANKKSPEAQAHLRDDARKAYQQALKIDPECLDATRALAGLYIKTNEYERAFDMYKKAMAKHPREAGLWYDLAAAHQRRKDLPESLRCLTKALELEPENRDYLKKLGFTLAWMGQLEQGFTYLARAQGKAQAHCNIARILIERDQQQLARQHIDLARQENPELPEANALLAWLNNGPTSTQSR